MGSTRRPQNQAISTLFSSTQGEVLGLLFGQPDRRFMGSELIRQVGRGTGAVHRQLKQLVSSGLVTITKQANQTFYQADPRHPIFPELRAIFLKTTGLAEPLREALAPFAGQIVAAFVFGSIASGRERPTSDVDVMILTDHSDALSYGQLLVALGSVAQLLGRPVNPIIMDRLEWHQKRMVEDSFQQQVADGEIIMILGDRADVG